jgi:hypothetical protein
MVLSLPLNVALARERFRSVGCKALEVAGGAPGNYILTPSLRSRFSWQDGQL